MLITPRCPNCRNHFVCYCTWEEKQQAKGILRRRAAEARKKTGCQTVIEEEIERTHEIIQES